MADNSTDEEKKIKDDLMCQVILNEEQFQEIKQLFDSHKAKTTKAINEIQDHIRHFETRLSETQLMIPGLLSIDRFHISHCNLTKGIIEACERGALPAVKHYVELGEKPLRRRFIRDDSNDIINIRDDDNRTLLMIAARNGYLNIVQYLLDKGIKIDDYDINSKTALSHAIENNRFNIAEFLSGNGADVNKKINGQTYLHRAIDFNNLKIVQTLVYHGASLLERNNLNKTPMEYASFLFRTEIEEYFKNYT